MKKMLYYIPISTLAVACMVNAGAGGSLSDYIVERMRHPGPGVVSTRSRIAEIEAEIARLTKHLNSLTNSIPYAMNAGTIDEVRSGIRKYEAQISMLRTQLQELREKENVR